MSAVVVVATYGIAVLIAVVLVFVYRHWRKKNYMGQPSTSLHNTGLPIEGGKKHFKIVNV